MLHFSLPRRPVGHAVSSALLFLTLLASQGALADTWSAQYFKAPAGTPDFYLANSGPIGVSNNFVLATLGPDGLPVFNPAYTAASGSVSAPAAMYLNAANELLWWTPTPTNNLVADGGGLLDIPAGGVAMYPAGQSGTDSPDEQTAILNGIFTLADATRVSFNVAADDVAFVYLDGTLVDSLSGIHVATYAPATTLSLAAGSHTLQVFYADQEQTGALLNIASAAPGIVVTPLAATPEPAGLALLGTGLAAVAAALRRTR